MPICASRERLLVGAGATWCLRKVRDLLRVRLRRGDEKGRGRVVQS